MAPAGVPGPATDLVLLHGTTIHRAQAICTSQSFNGTDPLYVVFRMHRDLAEFFARRKAARERSAPAVVRGSSGLISRPPTSRRKRSQLASDGHAGSPGRTRRNGCLVLVPIPAQPAVVIEIAAALFSSSRRFTWRSLPYRGDAPAPRAGPGLREPDRDYDPFALSQPPPSARYTWTTAMSCDSSVRLSPTSAASSVRCASRTSR